MMNASDQQDRSNRVEREILEILERSESKQRPIEHLQSSVRNHGGADKARELLASASGRSSRWLTTGILRLVAALLLAIAAAAVASLSSMLAVLLGIASAVAFFSLWFPSRGPSSMNAPRWRGQDLRDSGPPSFGGGREWPKGPRR